MKRVHKAVFFLGVIPMFGMDKDERTKSYKDACREVASITSTKSTDALPPVPERPSAPNHCLTPEGFIRSHFDEMRILLSKKKRQKLDQSSDAHE